LEVGDWLRSLGLAQYEAKFREHELDAEVLPEQTEADLQSLGIPLGHRKRLLKAIRALQTEAPVKRAGSGACARNRRGRRSTTATCPYEEPALSAWVDRHG